MRQPRLGQRAPGRLAGEFFDQKSFAAGPRVFRYLSLPCTACSWGRRWRIGLVHVDMRSLGRMRGLHTASGLYELPVPMLVKRAPQREFALGDVPHKNPLNSMHMNGAGWPMRDEVGQPGNVVVATPACT